MSQIIQPSTDKTTTMSIALRRHIAIPMAGSDPIAVAVEQANEAIPTTIIAKRSQPTVVHHQIERVPSVLNP